MLRNTFLARKKREGCGKEERRGYHRTPARNELQDDRRSNNYFFFFAAGFFAAGFFAAFFLAAMMHNLLLR